MRLSTLAMFALAVFSLAVISSPNKPKLPQPAPDNAPSGKSVGLPALIDESEPYDSTYHHDRKPLFVDLQCPTKQTVVLRYAVSRFAWDVYGPVTLYPGETELKLSNGTPIRHYSEMRMHYYAGSSKGDSVPTVHKKLAFVGHFSHINLNDQLIEYEMFDAVPRRVGTKALKLTITCQ